MATEQFPVGSDFTSGEMPGEQSKPSFVAKVKSKARKLKSKMKHHGSTENSLDHEAPSPGGRQGRSYTPGAVDQNNDETDTSESDDEGEIPYTPLSNSAQPPSQRPAGAPASNADGNSFGAPTSGQSAYDTHSTSSHDSFPAGAPVRKSAGPPGTQQAVPTNYNYYNSDPSTATLPSDYDDASQRQRDVPSSLGGESIGLTADLDKISNNVQHSFSAQDGSLSRSGHKASELPRSFMGSEDFEQKDDSKLVESSFGSLTSEPLEQDSGVGSYEPSSMSALTPHNSMNVFSEFAGGNGPFPEKVSDTTGGQSAANSFGNPSAESDKAIGGLAAATGAEATAAGVGYSKNGSSVKNTMDSLTDHTLKNDSSPLPTSESVTDGPNNDAFTGRQATSAKEANGMMDTPSSAEESSTWTQKAYELKNSLASNLGYAGSSASQADGSTAAKIPPTDAEQKPLMNRVTDTAYGLKDIVANKLGYGDQTTSTTDSTPVTQKVAASAAQGKDYAVKTFQSADQGLSSDEKPFSEKVAASAVQGKDYAVKTFQSADQGLSSDEKPVSEKLVASAVQGKDYVVKTFQSADQGLSSDERPVSEKASEAATKAKEDVLQKTAPDHHDKAFADSVSDSIMGLPSMLTSKLGLGGGSPTASSPSSTVPELGSTTKDGSAVPPTSNTPTSAASSYDSSTRKDTPYPDNVTTPGLFDRVSGIASSLFGGGATHPPTESKSL